MQEDLDAWESYQSYHRALLKQLKQRPELNDERVLTAIEAIPRHVFIPEQPLQEAYADKALPTSANQTISQPSLVAWMTQLLELSGTERVLEIGTGSGYQTALLSQLAKEVYSIERIDSLARRANQMLRQLGCSNVRVHVGDGYAGWPDAAPFDRILLTAAPPEMPQVLEDQLCEGGILVAPIGGQDGNQLLLKGVKRGKDVYAKVISEVRFVPMVAGVEEKKGHGTRDAGRGEEKKAKKSR